MTAFRYWSSTPFRQARSQSAANAAGTRMALPSARRKDLRMRSILPELLNLDVLSQIMRGHVRRVDGARVIGRDTRRRCPHIQLVRVRWIGNEVPERTVLSTPDNDAPQLAFFRCRIGERGPHINGVVFAHKHGTRLTELFPRGDEVAVPIEDLDPVVLAIGDIHMTLRTADVDVVGLVEIAGRRSLVSPGFDKPAVLRKFHDAGGVVLVGRMAIRHKDVPVRRDSNAGRTVEGIRTVPRHTLLADGHQNFTSRTQLQNFLAHNHARRVPGGHAENGRLVVYVADPQVPIAIDGEAVRIGEQSCTEALEKLARRIELQNRRIGFTPPDAGGVARRNRVEAPMEDPDVAVAADMHPDDLPPAASVHARRESGPTLHQTKGIGEFGWFGVTPLLCTGRGSRQGDGDRGGQQYKSRPACSCHRAFPLEIQDNPSARCGTDHGSVWSVRRYPEGGRRRKTIVRPTIPSFRARVSRVSTFSPATAP